jgi:hypothetical protein
MEETGEKRTDEEEIIGKVVITVYNDCFSLEHTAGLTSENIVELLYASIDKIDGKTEDHILH